MIVRREVDFSKPVKLTDKQVKMLEALKDRPIVFDEDCPELTEEQLKQFKRVSPERQKRFRS